jgi:hypothetical protein
MTVSTGLGGLSPVSFIRGRRPNHGEDASAVKSNQIKDNPVKSLLLLFLIGLLLVFPRLVFPADGPLTETEGKRATAPEGSLAVAVDGPPVSGAIETDGESDVYDVLVEDAPPGTVVFRVTDVSAGMRPLLWLVDSNGEIVAWQEAEACGAAVYAAVAIEGWESFTAVVEHADPGGTGTYRFGATVQEESGRLDDNLPVSSGSAYRLGQARMGARP